MVRSSATSVCSLALKAERAGPPCVRAPRATLWRAWTEPDLLKQWRCPRPWTTEVRAFDLRPGGAIYTFMRGPDGGTSDRLEHRHRPARGVRAADAVTFD